MHQSVKISPNDNNIKIPQVNALSRKLPDICYCSFLRWAGHTLKECTGILEDYWHNRWEQVTRINGRVLKSFFTPFGV
jgi:hypothetical protein